MLRHDFETQELQTNSSQPMYLQLVSLLKKMISQGSLKMGDVLPSEHEFCDMYHISRTTVRQALQALENEHMIERIKGKGTFVSSPIYSRTLNNLYSFSGEMKKLGFVAGVKMLSFEKVAVSEQLLEYFNMDDKEEKKLYEIKRVRTVNNVPLTLETVYIPEFICPGLNADLLKNGSLYELLNKLVNIIPATAKETYTVSMLTQNESELLECSKETCAFRVKRISYDVNVGLFEVSFITVRGDRCSYEVDLESDNVSFLRQIT